MQRSALARPQRSVIARRLVVSDSNPLGLCILSRALAPRQSGEGTGPDLIAAEAKLKIANPDRGARVDRFSANGRLSGGRLEQFRRASPDRLGSLRRNFLGQFGQFLGLDRERSELIAGMGTP